MLVRAEFCRNENEIQTQVGRRLALCFDEARKNEPQQGSGEHAVPYAGPPLETMPNARGSGLTVPDAGNDIRQQFGIAKQTAEIQKWAEFCRNFAGKNDTT